MESRETPLNQIILTDRKILQANGIMEVDSFDDKQIIAVSKLGLLVIKGEALHIVQLNLEEGKMALEGEVSTILYSESKQNKMKSRGKGIMERMFK